MFGILSKTPPSLDRFPAENWSVAQAECDGRPMIVRINGAARRYIAHPELKIRLGVTIAFNQPNEHGFCTADEGAQLGVIEDALCQALLSVRAAFPVMVLTTGGRREFVFYVKDQTQASRAVDKVAAGTSTHKLTYGFNDDPGWSYYAQFG